MANAWLITINQDAVWDDDNPRSLSGEEWLRLHLRNPRPMVQYLHAYYLPDADPRVKAGDLLLFWRVNADSNRRGVIGFGFATCEARQGNRRGEVEARVHEIRLNSGEKFLSASFLAQQTFSFAPAGPPNGAMCPVDLDEAVRVLDFWHTAGWQ